LTVIALRDPDKLADLFRVTLDLDRTLVGKLLDEADGDALLVLAKAAELSSTAFARMLILGKTGLTGSRATRSRWLIGSTPCPRQPRS
jgi:hypothetical protein